jgi:hypothetical protein
LRFKVSVEFYLSIDKEGKTTINKSLVGFTSFANSIKTLTQYRDLGKFTVNNKAKKAEELLNKVKMSYKG